jgi:hypothetical protein
VLPEFVPGLTIAVRGFAVKRAGPAMRLIPIVIACVGRLDIPTQATSKDIDRHFVKGSEGDEVSVSPGNEGRGDGRRCALGVCWDTIALKVTSTSAHVAGSFIFVGVAVRLVWIGVVAMMKR